MIIVIIIFNYKAISLTITIVVNAITDCFFEEVTLSWRLWMVKFIWFYRDVPFTEEECCQPGRPVS